MTFYPTIEETLQARRVQPESSPTEAISDEDRAEYAKLHEKVERLGPAAQAER